MRAMLNSIHFILSCTPSLTVGLLPHPPATAGGPALPPRRSGLTQSQTAIKFQQKQAAERFCSLAEPFCGLAESLGELAERPVRADERFVSRAESLCRLAERFRGLFAF